MALNVSLKFSLFGTRYKISSVTRQPVRKKTSVNIKFSTLYIHKSIEAMQCTIKAADTPNVQVSQDGVPPQVQVVWNGL